MIIIIVAAANSGNKTPVAAPAAPIVTSSPTTNAPATTTPAVPVAPSLTGLGATIAQFKAAHGVDHGPGVSCQASNSCFGGGLQNAESGKTYQFTTVDTGDGIVFAYDQSFLDNTTIAEAKAEVLQWMPKDTTVTSFFIDTNGGTCAMMNLVSPTLGKVLGDPKIGDPQGVVGVEFSYTNSNENITYNPDNVQDAVVDIVPASATVSC